MNELMQNYDDVLKPRTVETMDTIAKHYDGLEAAFSKIARDRQVSKCLQFKAIFKRNLVYLLRNPRTTQALFFNVTITALIYLAVYFKIGDPDPFTPAANR